MVERFSRTRKVFRAIGNVVKGERLTGRHLTLSRGKIVHSIKYEDLPRSIQSNICLLAERRGMRKRNFLYEVGAGAVVGLTGAAIKLNKFFDLAHVPKMVYLGIPLGMMATGTAEAVSRTNEIRGIHFAIGKSIFEHREEHAEIQAAFNKGATHLVIDRKGTVHFVKAPDNLTGKLFRPIFGRIRAAVKPKEVEAVGWLQKKPLGIQ